MLELTPESKEVLKTIMQGFLKMEKNVAKKLRKNLRDKLLYLHKYACWTEDDKLDLTKTKCRLMTDFAPWSFAFAMSKENRHWFPGGLIFHGSHDGFGSGSAPTLSVCVTPTDGWSIHT